MPSATLGEMRAKRPQDNTPDTYYARNDDGGITYVHEGREVEYEEYLDLLRNDNGSGISLKDRDIMIGETPAPGESA